MEIWHRVGFDSNVQHSLDKASITYKTLPSPHRKIGIIYFDIEESDPHWVEVKTLIHKFKASNIYDTVFTKEEILDAKWNRLIPMFAQGYPQPESSWATNPITYAGHCSKCGTYEKQQESFRIKKEPRLGKNQYMTFHWGYALFTIPAILAEFAKHQLQGYENWDVLIHKTSEPSKSISQVHVPHTAKASFIPEDTLERKQCSQCGITKYYPHMRGYMHFNSDLFKTDLDFMLSNEWFGSGHDAYREILVSNKVARLIVENKWRGVKLKPVEIT